MKDFFTNPQFREQLRHSAETARDRIAGINPISEVVLGDCFLFHESDDLPVRWVAVLPHKDNSSLWFLLAADEFEKVGTCDVEIPDSAPMSPLVLRCNIGFWADQDDIDLERYVGRLDTDSVADARSRLSEMVHGRVPVTESGVITEANDDYRQWISDLGGVAERIEVRLQSEPVVLRSPVFDTTWTDLSLVAESRLEYGVSLAADATGQQDNTSEIPPALVLQCKLLGQLLLLREGAEFDLVYYPVAKEDQPPAVMKASGISASGGQWVIGADGVWTWSQVFGSKNGRLSFTIGSESFDISIV